MKKLPSQLYVVCNILSEASHTFEVYDNAIMACEWATKQALRHNGLGVIYECISLEYYLLALTEKYSLLYAFNEYNRD